MMGHPPETALIEGYHLMAKDAAGEAEAAEWADGLLADANDENC